MKLNLGAGQDKREGFVSVDIQEKFSPDVVADVRRLPFSDQSADEIIAIDVLEHLPRHDLLPTLKEWHRVLKPGGNITIRVPHLLKIARKMLCGSLSSNTVIKLIYGNQRYGGEDHPGNYHRSGLTEDQFRRILPRIGFTIVSIEDPSEEHNLVVVAQRP